MSGQNGHGSALGPASDEAARLEAALARIAKAASKAALHATAPHEALAGGSRSSASPQPLPVALHATAGHATTAGGGPDTAEIAARLDGLIAEIRALLGSQDI